MVGRLRTGSLSRLSWVLKQDLTWRRVHQPLAWLEEMIRLQAFHFRNARFSPMLSLSGKARVGGLAGGVIRPQVRQTSTLSLHGFFVLVRLRRSSSGLAIATDAGSRGCVDDSLGKGSSCH